MTQNKETLAYAVTGVISTMSYLEVFNGVLTSLVILATLIYWIQKNLYIRKQKKDDSSK
jgi:hypothetical protein